jgi:acetyl-CoA carboxylase biotin carboxylase subunit
VSLFYDPLLAKLIAWGETRDIALDRMRRALRELVIVGVPTSQSFHLRLLEHPEFREGQTDIAFLDRVGSQLQAAGGPPGLDRALAVAAAVLADERRGVGAHTNGAAAASLPVDTAWALAARRDGLRE